MRFGFRLPGVRVGYSNGRASIGATLGPLSASMGGRAARTLPDGSTVLTFGLEQVAPLLVNAGWRFDSYQPGRAVLVRGWRAVELTATPEGTRVRDVLPPAVQIGLVLAVAAVMVACCVLAITR